MARIALHPPLVPRDGRVLQVLDIDRISTLNQDPRSNDDQWVKSRRWVEDRFDGQTEWTRITGQGSGECLDREQVRQADELVATRKFDLVIMEDLGRHLRRIQAIDLCELCEDSDTRLVAINDGIDTAGNWKLHAFFAALRHEQYNKDTSERIKRTLRNRFLQGGALERRIYGYVDPPGGAKTDADRRKDPDAEPIYKRWFEMLEQGASYTDVADWLNAREIPTGPYCRSDKWNTAIVRRITLNPILRGERRHNDRITKRVNNPGKYVSVLADPADLLVRHCPHLAFFDDEHYDQVVRIAVANNSKFAPGKNGHDPRRGRPKKKTKWPGQHIYCGVCGRLYRYGGHGQNDHLLCSGAYGYRCWHAITVDGPEAALKISKAVFREISSLPEFDAAFTERLNAEARGSRDRNADQLRNIERDLTRNERHTTNIKASLREYGPSETLLEELRILETEKAFLRVKRKKFLSMPERRIEIPSMEELRTLTLDAVQHLAIESEEFSRLIRRLIPRIIAIPVRLVDGGHIVLRAWFVLDLVPLVPDARHIPSLEHVLRRRMLVDLFDPPQREAFREQVMAWKEKGTKRKTERQIARELGIAQAVVQRAAALARKMESLGVTSPYQLVTEPPDGYTKLRRHKHPRYKFDPLPHVDLF